MSYGSNEHYEGYDCKNPFSDVGYGGEKVLRTEILGVPYEIKFVPFRGDEVSGRLLDVPDASGVLGITNKHARVIYISTDSDVLKSFGDDRESVGRLFRETLRHELIHAFLSESGLGSCSLRYDYGWSQNEEMVDWLAVMAPRIFEKFKELNCIG